MGFRLSSQEPLGFVDVSQLLDDTKGKVEFSLFDSGTIRKGSSIYEYENIGKDRLRVWSRDINGKRAESIVVHRLISLVPQTILFFGLYIGDGVKAARPGSKGVLSLSQREPHISGFARSQFVKLFGSALRFTHSVNEDGLFFMSHEMRTRLSAIRHKLLDDGKKVMNDSAFEAYLKRDLDDIINEQAPTMKTAIGKYKRKRLFGEFGKYLPEFFANRPFMDRYLKEIKVKELEESGNPLAPNDTISVNVRLPGVKGAREPGKSSRSDELTVDGMGPFRALFLRILSDTYSSIAENQATVSVDGSQTPWIRWKGPPHSASICRFKSAEYLRASRSARKVMARTIRRYKVVEGPSRNRVLTGSESFEVPKVIGLTPLVCLFAGLYLAEGATPKSKLFHYSDERVGGLGVALTASEDDTLSVCMNSISSLVVSDFGKVQAWRLKIGAKYFPEAATVGNKIGVPVLRRGPKGQGAASAFELVEAVSEWARKAMPSLEGVSKRFDHLEYTGAGIPRVDIFYDDSIAVFLFSIMRNLIINPSEFEKFEVP
jgi:hypothetical protein